MIVIKSDNKDNALDILLYKNSGGGGGIHRGFHKKNINYYHCHHIRMISEGSCDSEDCFWKFSYAISGINYILKYNKIENSYFKL